MSFPEIKRITLFELEDVETAWNLKQERLSRAKWAREINDELAFISSKLSNQQEVRVALAEVGEELLRQAEIDESVSNETETVDEVGLK